jgi:ABC-type uncharacterized transport system auxiliary subunit
MRIASFRSGRTHSLAQAAPSSVPLSAGTLSILAIALLVAGCGSARPIKYYQLTYATTAPPPSPDAINTTLMVRSFEASHLYLSDQIVYGFDSPEMGVYQSQRWAEPPVEMLQDALVRGLRSTGRFRAVYTIRSDMGGQYILGGHLYDFKEVDGSAIVARLNYEVRLRDRKSGTTVWSHMYTHDEAASEKTVSAIAVAMDKNVQRSVQEVQAGLEEYFRANPPR